MEVTERRQLYRSIADAMEDEIEEQRRSIGCVTSVVAVENTILKSIHRHDAQTVAACKGFVITICNSGPSKQH